MKKLLFKGPVTTASGYGVHARQLLRAVLESGKYDVSVQAIKWGETSFVSDDTPETRRILDLVMKYDAESRAKVKYDVSIQVTIPNEFEKLADVNIGVTAGIEVDRVSPIWIDRANERVDLVVVPSVHSATTYSNVQYKDESSGNILRLNKPLAVVPEGVDTSVYNTEPVDDLVGLHVDTKFNFLSVGLGLDRGFGEDRKNISHLVKWFCERFKNSRDVGLVLKVGLLGSSLIDHEMTRRRIESIKKAVGVGEFPRIYLVHGRLTDAQMASLYKHKDIKAYVTFTHGEGYGLPIIEAAACGLPVIATNWSGHLDFLTVEGKKKFVPVEFDMTQIPNSVVWDGVMERGTNWATVREDDAKSKMAKVVASYEKPKQWADELSSYIKDTLSLEKVCNYFNTVLDRFFEVFVENTGPARDRAGAIVELRKNIDDGSGRKTLLYTMPMSAGDVFVSTAVVDSLRKKHPDHRIIFATDKKYAPILEKNPDIENVIDYEMWMQDVPFCEQVFDEVYTPNLAIQTVHANWVRGGKGRRLAEEMAAQCQVELGEYKVVPEEVSFGLPEKFVAFHPGAGTGQWEARNYLRWQDVVSNITRLSGLPVVQVGTVDEPLYQGVVDVRGQTTYRQLAHVISKAACLVGIDSVSMHMAAGLGTPHVALFGSSYANSTGPAKSKGLSVLLETPDRYTCDKACYKYECSVKKEHPCINEIDPRDVVLQTLNVLLESGHAVTPSNIEKYQEYRPKISGYTHLLDAETHGFPYVESITSMLGFCDEVVVVDGGSDDGTVERVKAIGDDRVKLFTRKWDWKEPGMDGMQKAYARAMCTGEFLWQQDADEVVHEDDYEKVRKLARKFPKDVDLLHLPVVELWGDGRTVRTDRHSWKWRFSRNNFRITHGINKHAREFDQNTGRTYAKKGMSDGCEYVDIMTGEFLPHKGFYTQQLENLRNTNPEEYGEEMNRLFGELPSVFHYSWADIPRKIRNFKKFWNACWSNLYNDPEPEDRFPDVTDEESAARKAAEVKERGGEHRPARTFVLGRSNPAVMQRWLGGL